MGGKEGEDSDDDGMDADEGDDRPPTCEEVGGGKAVEMARGME